MDTSCPRSVPSLASDGDEPAQRSCALLACLETHIKTRVYPTFTKHPYNTIHLPSCIELMSKSMTSYPLTYGGLGIRFAVPLSHGGRESSFYPLTHGRTSMRSATWPAGRTSASCRIVRKTMAVQERLAPLAAQSHLATAVPGDKTPGLGRREWSRWIVRPSAAERLSAEPSPMAEDWVGQ